MTFPINELFYEFITLVKEFIIFQYYYLKNKFNSIYFISLWLRFVNTWYWSKTLEFTVETNVFSCRDLTVILMVNGHIWTLLSKLTLWNGLLRTFLKFLFRITIDLFRYASVFVFSISVSVVKTLHLYVFSYCCCTTGRKLLFICLFFVIFYVFIAIYIC